MTQNEEYVTATEARDLLGVSQYKMTAMIHNGEIATYPDPFNKRAKLIKRADIDAWLAQAKRPRKPHKRQNEGEEKDRAA
jgi:excisionase family DNA binding protein